MNTIRNALWAVRTMWQAAPGLAALHALSVLLDSVGPALQVVLVSRIVTVVARHDPDAGGRDLIVTIAVAALVFGLSHSVRDITMTLSQVVERKVQSETLGAFARAMAAVPARQLLDADLATRARTARDAISSNVSSHGSYTINSLRAVLAMGFIVAALSPYSVGAALVIVLAAVPTLVAFTRVARIEAEAWPRMSEEAKKANYATDQLVYERSAFELSSLNAGRYFADRASRHYERSASIFVRSMFASSGWIALAGLVSTGLLGWALYLLATSPTGGPGALAGGLVALLAGMAATSDAAYTLGGVIAGTPAVEAYRQFTSPQQAPTGSASDEPYPDVHLLEARGVTFTYPGRDRPAVSGASLTARRGEMVGIVGLNGMGKTSLVHCLMGLLQPECGAVELDGVDVFDLAVSDRLRPFGLLSQDYGRYELTVREALTMGSARSELTDGDLWKALDSVRLTPVVEQLPKGLDAQLGQQFGGVGLSGGQWQRLALARIAMRRAPIWILDEPTSSVDAETERGIFQDLGATRASRITLVVSHRPSTLVDLDRIYVMHEGRIVQEGRFEELIARPGRFSDMFRGAAPETS